MDGVSAAASIIAVVQIAYSSAQALYDVIDGIKNAPDVIKGLNNDLSALQTVLNSVTTTLENSDKAVLAPLFIRIGIEPALKSCFTICDGFTMTIKKYTKHSTDDKISKRDRLTVTFRKSKIESFTARLNVSKATVALAVNSAVLATSSRMYSSTEEFQTKLTQQSSALEAQMKQLTTVENEIKDLAIAGDAEDPDNDIIPITNAERDQTLTLLPVLREVCKQALVVTTEQATRQSFSGHMFTDKNSRVQQGVVGKAVGNVDQKFAGNMKTTNGSSVFQGQMDSAAFKAMWAAPMGGGVSKVDGGEVLGKGA